MQGNGNISSISIIQFRAQIYNILFNASCFYYTLKCAFTPSSAIASVSAIKFIVLVTVALGLCWCDALQAISANTDIKIKYLKLTTSLFYMANENFRFTFGYKNNLVKLSTSSTRVYKICRNN